MPDYIYNPNSGELYHYGVKGMKWGVRRYQNPDGSLTPRGKKRISKQYKKAADDVNKEFAKNYNRMYVNAYNKAADRMNKGGIDEFNASQKKKYGEKYTTRDGYEEDYANFFDQEFTKQYNLELNDFYKNSSSYKKTKALVDKYGMTSWNDLAKQNEAAVDEIRKYAEQSQTKAKKSETQSDKKVRQEEKKMVKDMMKTYDKSDPDYEEAMAILEEIYNDLD